MIRTARMRRLQPRLSIPRRERGAILIITLMFLVLLTIVGVASISSATLEEKMAGNLREQYTAFQAAESALRDAEIDLEAAIGGTVNRDPLSLASFVTLCSAAAFPVLNIGVCTQPAAPPGTYRTEIVTAAGWDWTSATKTVPYGSYTGAAQLGGVFRQPRYVIEYLAEKIDPTVTVPLTRHFRITARGWGANQNTTITLQTVYKMPMN